MMIGVWFSGYTAGNRGCRFSAGSRGGLPAAGVAVSTAIAVDRVFFPPAAAGNTFRPFPHHIRHPPDSGEAEGPLVELHSNGSPPCHVPCCSIYNEIQK